MEFKVYQKELELQSRGWIPYYLEYTFKEDLGTHFHEVMDTFYTDVEFYMDMSEHLQYVRLPNALRVI